MVPSNPQKSLTTWTQSHKNDCLHPAFDKKGRHKLQDQDNQQCLVKKAGLAVPVHSSEKMRTRSSQACKKKTLPQLI